MSWYLFNTELVKKEKCLSPCYFRFSSNEPANKDKAVRTISLKKVVAKMWFYANASLPPPPAHGLSSVHWWVCIRHGNKCQQVRYFLSIHYCLGHNYLNSARLFLRKANFISVLTISVSSITCYNLLPFQVNSGSDMTSGNSKLERTEIKIITIWHLVEHIPTGLIVSGGGHEI